MMYSRLGKRIDDWFYPLSPLAWQVRLDRATWRR